jgi:hypothetical protein
MWGVMQRIVFNWPSSLLNQIYLCLDGLHGLNEAI